MVDRVGQQLGNYRLTRLLGQGGFADVYLGEHIYLKTQAAIKVMQMRLANDDMESFVNEARTIAGLKHPHIVRVLDFGIDSGTPFLVMDYAPMGTLRLRHPRGTRLPPAIISSYVKQVAAALQYAHDRKLIHRDIKPENMLLESDNEILLSDFGIALVAQSSHYQNTQDSVGTLAYMAPEQLQGHPRIASDQYSLGVVVYEWLTGDRPFHGSFIEMASQHMLVPPPPLREKVPDILSPIEEVVMVALAKDPQQRFANMQAFANAFEQACQLAPVQSSELSNQQLEPTILVNLPSQELPPTIAMPPKSPLPPTVKASSSAKVSQSSGTMLYIYRGHSDWIYGVAWSPDGKYIASASDKVHIWDASSGSRVLRYSNHTNWVSVVAWSPDGTRIASASDDETVRLWSTASSRTLLTYHEHSASINAAIWSPDGSRIASASADRTVRIWDSFNGRNIYTYRGHSNEVNYVAWSPDGSHIASASLGEVHVWQARQVDD